jgi:hypothetical protein
MLGLFGDVAGDFGYQRHGLFGDVNNVMSAVGHSSGNLQKAAKQVNHSSLHGCAVAISKFPE